MAQASGVRRAGEKQKRPVKSVCAGGACRPKVGRSVPSATRFTSENGLPSEVSACIPGTPDSPPRPDIIPSLTPGACSQHDYANANFSIVSFLHQTQARRLPPYAVYTQHPRKSSAPEGRCRPGVSVQSRWSEWRKGAPTMFAG